MAKTLSPGLNCIAPYVTLRATMAHQTDVTLLLQHHKKLATQMPCVAMKHGLLHLHDDDGSIGPAC